MSAFGTDGFHATSLDALAASLGVTKQTVLHHFGSKDGLLAATTEAAAAMLSQAVGSALAKPGNPDQRLTHVVHAIFGLAARRPELLGFVRDLSRLGSVPLANLRTALAPFIHQASTFVAEEMFGAFPTTSSRVPSPLAVSREFGQTTSSSGLSEISHDRGPIPEPTASLNADLNTDLKTSLEASIATSFESSFEAMVAQQRRDALDVVLAGYAAVLAAAAEVEVLRSLGVEPTGRLFLRRRREVIEYLRFLAAAKPSALPADSLERS